VSLHTGEDIVMSSDALNSLAEKSSQLVKEFKFAREIKSNF
jgi:hypothetical protein